MYHVEFAPEPLLPRERLLACGADQLSNQELLAILLRTGRRGEPVLQLAQTILTSLKSLADLRSLSIQELQALPGIGQIKAIEIQAMLEFSHRIQLAEQTRLDQVVSSQGLAKRMMLEVGNKQQEYLVALYLDTQNRVIQKEVIFIGSVNRSVAEPREILYHACKALATSVILVHNHPSGICKPSDADERFTARLKRCCEDLGLMLLDHIIVGKKTYYSFREKTDLLD